MSITLRPYQQAAIDGIRDAYSKRHRSVLFVLPTGGGKTVVFSSITTSAAAKGNRVCILVHRAELLRQASASLTSLGVRHGLIAAGRSMDLTQPVQVASVQTLARRLHKLSPGLFQLLVVDEAHHSNAGTWAQVLNHFARAKVLGVTATPCRCDGRGLGEWYSAMVLGPTPQQLTDGGFLAPARVLAPPGMSLQGLRKRMGDYDMRQAGEMLQAGQAMGDALSHYRQHLEGQTAITFCCSVAHAEAVADLFNRHGITAASIDGSMDALQRERLLADLGAGRLKVLTSCSLIGEGVDVPSVAGCILLRPTQSVSLHLQMIGRCLRPQPGKVAVVLDHVGNCLRLGHHLDEREWTLEGLSKRDGPRAPSVKVCPACFCAMPSGKPECAECGHRFTPERRELEHVEGQLQELRQKAPPGGFKIGDLVISTKSKVVYTIASERRPHPGNADCFYYECVGTNRIGHSLKQHIQEQMLEMATKSDLQSAYDHRREQAQARTMQELVAIGKRRGMKSPYAWAHHVMQAREAKRVPA